jgi:predicted AlkP superfamily pyrophosphatase or phosphodiesterase
MLDNGATTQNARASYELTTTLPNHTSMLTGRPITGAGGHEVTFNDDDGSTLTATAGSYVRGIFDVVHDHGGSTAFYSAKSKLDFLERSWDATHGAPDTVGTDDGRDKIDRYHVDTEHDNVSRLVTRMHEAPDELSFVHLAYPDRAGHRYGFMSAAYVHAVFQADRQLGRILAAVRDDTRLLAHTNVILTADHGGKGASHSDSTRPYNYVIPFMVWGRGVTRGADLYDLNTGSRARPALRRPTYAGTQPIRNAEVANLAADLLDLPVVPGSLLDASQDLTVR